jgi:three-Cys-motif partner protein
MYFYPNLFLVKSQKKKAKDIVLPHSQAKLDLYKSYLEKYFAILGLAKGVDKINLFDIFCGIGIYKDGNIGSPLIAFECIKNNNELFNRNHWQKKPIYFLINDGSKDKVENVKNILTHEKIENLSVDFFNLDANEMLDEVIKKVQSASNSERNLIFIDPYGYSEIDKTKIYNILKTNYSEILLFLPVMQMYRFSEIAMTDFEKKCYEDLRKFIFDFIPSFEKCNNVFDFINDLTDAFSFEGRFFSCAHYIERDKGNYYAVFFITPHIYGFERMLSVKWEKDQIFGQGFRKPEKQTRLFEMEEAQEDQNLNLTWLGRNIRDFLVTGHLKNNLELYEFVLRKRFLPKHANELLKIWQQKKQFVIDFETEEPLKRKNSFYLSFKEYKTKQPKVKYKID